MYSKISVSKTVQVFNKLFNFKSVPSEYDNVPPDYAAIIVNHLQHTIYYVRKKAPAS